MIDKLDSLSTITSLIQVILGGFVFTLFKVWLLREDEINKAVALKKEKKYEEVCDSVQNLLDRSLNEEIPLRGNGGEYPDVVLSFAKKIIGVSNEFETLKRSKNLITNLNTFLISTSLLGVVFLILAQCINSHFYIISLASIFIIVSQIIAFLIIRMAGLKLSKFEDL